LSAIPGVSLAAALGIKLSPRPEVDKVVAFRIGDCAGFRAQWAYWEDTLVHAGSFLNPRVPLFKSVCGPLVLWNAELKFYPETHSLDIHRFMSRCSVLSAKGVRRVMPTGVGVGFSFPPDAVHRLMPSAWVELVAPTSDDWRHEKGGPFPWASLGAGEKLKIWVYSQQPFSARHDFRFRVSLRVERPTAYRPGLS